jgi:hypothetical protein
MLRINEDVDHFDGTEVSHARRAAWTAILRFISVLLSVTFWGMAKPKRYCENQWCRKPLHYPLRSDARFCCAACRAKRYRWLTAGRERMGDRLAAGRTCAQCHGPINPYPGLDLRRADARYCSSRCRVAVYRRRLGALRGPPQKGAAGSVGKDPTATPSSHTG